MAIDDLSGVHFESWAPFTFAEYMDRYHDKIMALVTGPGAAHLRNQTGPEAKLVAFTMYVGCAIKLKCSEATFGEMMYPTAHALCRYFLDEGHSPEEVRAEIRRGPWETLPGMEAYAAETGNAVSVRALNDALQGRYDNSIH